MSQRFLAFAISLCLVAPATAVDFRIQPRIETGFMHYELEQKASVSPNLITSRSNIGSLSGFTISDVMPVVSGGFTFFVDRFFVDFSGSHAFNGSDRTMEMGDSVTRAGSFPFLTDTLLHNETNFDHDFDRTDASVSVGFQVTDHWTLFAGYKYTEADFTQELNGEIDAFTLPGLTNVPLVSGSFIADGAFSYTYDGPFVGTNYSWPIDYGWLRGNLTGNFAIAFLEGEAQQTVTNTFFSSNAGVSFPFDVSRVGLSIFDPKLRGDTVGLSFGLGWKGHTGWRDLTYSVNAAGYRYEFDSDTNARPDFNETMIRFNVGLAYTFDL